MIKTRNLQKWTEFRTVVDEIRHTYGCHEYSLENGQIYKHENTILFRGQASARWPLRTTLERKTSQEFTLAQYLQKVRGIVSELESYTEKKWNLSDVSSLEEIIKSQDKTFGLHILPDYGYLAYLRHHGYPSPLLDWSESPYIAAYFAMCDAHLDEKKPPQKQRVAVYVYIESTNSGKDFFGENAPKIQLEGPRISTHKRHFIQKAQYTIAWKWSGERKDHVFCFHDEVFDRKRPDQDILIKITVPIVDKKLALKELEDYNINHHTLFQTEDALVKRLGMREFDL